MSLASGSSLGSYEILGTLGVGGMGEVYRARDTRLGREVAVKVVLEAFLLDRERLVRFEREAKSLAALNHPNIATLFGMEESEGRHFLVMELVEGETLAEKIARAPLPLEAAISTARQIADALETAHDKGIVHRDLKPANVKITPDDKVKVLDFGLARAMDPPSPEATAGKPGYSMNSPTLSAMATQAGMILGTASYMSPEQARGMPADHRSDIFSFGVVLYEMLTGRQPFQGETVSDVLASVLAREPDLASLPPDLAPRLSELLRRCLEKQPKRRWQAIGDVRHELEIITSNPRHVPATQTMVAVAAPPRSWWRRAMPIAAAALGASIITGGAMWLSRPKTPAGVVSRFVMPFEEGQQTQTTNVSSLIAISPDGSRIAYTAIPSRQIFVRAIGDLDARPITEERTGNGPRSLVFSPQGESIAYHDPLDSTIKRIEVTGGAPVTVCKATGAQGIGWTGDTIVYAIEGGIMRVPVSGGEPQQLIALGKDETASHPQLLDDGRVLFTLAERLTAENSTPWSKARIVVQKPGDSTRTTLVEGAFHARYLPTGHLVYLSGGVLFGRTFNPATNALGGAVSLVEGIEGVSNGSGGWYDVSATGSLVYIPGAVGTKQPNYTIALIDRAGKAEPLGVPAGPYSGPRMSPDGRRVAFGFSDTRDTSIWIYDIAAGGSARRLTFGGRDRFPAWSSDSQRVIFQSDREGDLGLFWQRADGVGSAERLTKPDKGVSHVAQSASRDGRWLLMDQTADSKTSLMVFSFKDKSATLFGGVISPYPTGATFSPDDRWVAYSMREQSGVVIVQPFPATGAKVQVSPNSEDGHHQVWSSDGKELYYTPGAGNRLTAVTVMASQGFAFGPAPPVTRLFRNLFGGFERTYDVARDGKRFLGLLSPEALSAGATSRPEMRVVLNWFEELKARAPVK